jgi:agmatinase
MAHLKLLDTCSDFDFMDSQDGFLGLSGDDAFSPERAKAWLIPFGLESSVSYEGGTAFAPDAILKASHQVELFDEVFWREVFRDYGVATMVAPAIEASLEGAINQIERLVADCLSHDKFPLILGGEHSITAGAIRSFVSQHEQITILQFDAHADLRDEYDDTRYSHACAMRRVLDHDNVRLVSVGVRNISSEEIPFLDENKNRIEIFWGKDRARWSIDEIVKAVGTGPVYVTFDVDGFDSSLMPATGTPEPGGFFWDDAMTILADVAKNANIVGADIVELAPTQGLHACDFLVARLTYRILSYALGSDNKKI